MARTEASNCSVSNWSKLSSSRLAFMVMLALCYRWVVYKCAVVSCFVVGCSGCVAACLGSEWLCAPRCAEWCRVYAMESTNCGTLARRCLPSTECAWICVLPNTCACGQRAARIYSCVCMRGGTASHHKYRTQAHTLHHTTPCRMTCMHTYPVHAHTLHHAHTPRTHTQHNCTIRVHVWVPPVAPQLTPVRALHQWFHTQHTAPVPARLTEHPTDFITPCMYRDTLQAFGVPRTPRQRPYAYRLVQ